MPSAERSSSVARVDHVRLDPVLADRLGHDRRLHLAVLLQRMQRRDDHVLGVDLEVTAQRLARVAATEPIGAERDETIGDPARRHVVDGLHPITGHDDRTLGPLERLRHVGHARLLGRVQTIPALRTQRIGSQQ